MPNTRSSPLVVANDAPAISVAAGDSADGNDGALLQNGADHGLADSNQGSHDPYAALGTLADVSGQQTLDPLAARLFALKTWLRDDLANLEAAIDEVCAADTPDLAQQSAAHLLALPGKRIRPLCTILAAKLGGRDLDNVVRDLAVACELVHAATLLHDDVIDLGDERRGEPTARLAYGNSASILGGDYLLIEALRRVNRSGLPHLLTSLLGVIDQMVHAEALQLARRGRFDPSRRVYLAVIEGKTASLFRWGLTAGAQAAGMPAEQVNALGQVGLHFGMAFQLTDDVLDLAGDPETTGKSAFADLREGKLTWPLIDGAERDPALAADLAAAVHDPARFEAERLAPSIARRLDALGAVQATREKAAHHAAEALRALRMVPAGRARHAIEAVIEAVVSRSA